MTNKCEICNKPTIDYEDKLCYECFGYKCCERCGFNFVPPDGDCDCDCEPIEDVKYKCFTCYKECLMREMFYKNEGFYCSIICRDYQEGIKNLKKPKLEDVIKSIKNDKTDYSYLFD